jgi:hypothetical protein
VGDPSSHDRWYVIDADAPGWLVADPTIVNSTIGHLPRRVLTAIPLDMIP